MAGAILDSIGGKAMGGSDIVKGKVHVSKLSWFKVMVSTVVPLLIAVIFAVYHILHGALCVFLGKCFGRPSRV